SASNGTNTVAAGPAPSCIALPTPCVTVPVTITRTDPTGLKHYAVTIQLSANLTVCGAGIAAGGYLGGVGPTSFSVTDNGGGSYTVDEALTAACGASGDGTLFTVPVSSASAAGTGTITVTTVALTDCGNGPVPALIGSLASVTIDQVVPASVSALTATQVTSGNDSDGTTKITLAFTAPGDVASVEIYRAGYGNYPEYDDAPGAGSVPAAPSYPPSAPWSLTSVTASGQTDETATRDYWYYVAFAKDGCGNVSAVSTMTGGTLNYHLGDVSNGITVGVGDNLVTTADVSLLGSHYGL